MQETEKFGKAKFVSDMLTNVMFIEAAIILHQMMHDLLLTC